MSIGTIVVNGVTVEIETVGMSEVQNINGAKELHVFLEPVFPGGPNGGGEPLPIEDAA